MAISPLAVQRSSFWGESERLGEENMVNKQTNDCLVYGGLKEMLVSKSWVAVHAGSFLLFLLLRVFLCEFLL